MDFFSESNGFYGSVRVTYVMNQGDAVVLGFSGFRLRARIPATHQGENSRARLCGIGDSSLATVSSRCPSATVQRKCENMAGNVLHEWDTLSWQQFLRPAVKRRKAAHWEGSRRSQSRPCPLLLPSVLLAQVAFRGLSSVRVGSSATRHIGCAQRNL
jgi:hypothetical protein